MAGFWQRLELALMPERALARAHARHALGLEERLYDITDPRRAARYPAPRGRGYSPDEVNYNAGTRVRDQARHADENNDFAIAIFDAMVNQVAPLEPRPVVVAANGDPLERVNAELEAMWEELTDSSSLSVAGTPWPELKRQLARAWLRDGDVFVRPLLGDLPGLERRGEVPLSLACYEAEWVPEWLTEDGVVQGVRVNQYGRPITYYMHREHPGPGHLSGLRGIPTRLDFLDVPARELLVLKHSRRVSQVRGVSVLHGVLTRLCDLKDYEESERLAARIAASFAAVIERQATGFGAPVAADVTSSGSRSLELEGGMIMDFARPGETVKTIDTNRPSDKVTDFRAAMQRAAAAGTGTSYSTISRDYGGSYSSQRQELVEAKPQYDRLRAHWVHAFLRPVWHQAVQAALMSGRVRPRGLTFRELTRASFDGAVMPWIDPAKETQADVTAIANGLKSREQVIRERGGNPRQVLAETLRDPFPNSQQPSEAPTDET